MISAMTFGQFRVRELTIMTSGLCYHVVCSLQSDPRSTLMWRSRGDPSRQPPSSFRPSTLWRCVHPWNADCRDKRFHALSFGWSCVLGCHCRRRRHRHPITGNEAWGAIRPMGRGGDKNERWTSSSLTSSHLPECREWGKIVETTLTQSHTQT